MSSALVRKSLEIVDGKERIPEIKVPRSNKRANKTSQNNKKDSQFNTFQNTKRIAITEARKLKKSKDKVFKKNLKTLKTIKEHCTLDLDKNLVKKIIERGVVKRPIKIREPNKKKETAFTEEDFQKFEEEYTGE